jgi:hypothetical protein
MKISDYVKVTDKFQKSVNIDFDLYKSGKLQDYIPTSDICEVLGEYFLGLLGNDNHSTFLVGPYGKGKSFLVLSLLQLVCSISDEDETESFVAKVNSVDPVLGKTILKIKAKKIRYLPVIVNSDYDNLKQSFMVALRQSLLSNHLDTFVPKSTFDDCVSILDYWMNDPVISKGRLAECKKDCDLNELRNSLYSHSISGYEDFVSLYNCVSIGQRFNPLVNEDAPRLYSEVANEIKKQEFTGIFVVFDEFSKFLESKSRHLGEDLKFIQDFAEMANRSDGNYSVNICCIAHKPITQYSANNSRTADLLKTVDGRFLTFRFHRGMKENTELISNAIKKNPGFQTFFQKISQERPWLYDSSKNLGLLDPGDDFEEFSKGVYPLTPVAACLLIRVSELVAQNERTIFTFISGKDTNGLWRLCQKDGILFVGADAIYDYFREQISLSDDQTIKNECYLADAALREQRDDWSQKIIKVITLLKIVNDPSVLKPTREVISLALGVETEAITSIIEKLIQVGIIRENYFDGSLDFSLVGSKEINYKAENLLAKELRHVDPIEYLNRLEKKDYYLPNAYNVRHRITRYCRYSYLHYSTFLQLSNFSGFRPDCDILILRIIGAPIDSSKVQEVLNRAKDSQVTVEVGKAINCDNLTKLLKYYAAYLKMAESNGNGIAYDAVSVVIDECESEILQIVQDAFSEESVSLFSSVKLTGSKTSERINSLFEEVYYATPLINNEMLNRNNVTPQYLKARNNVVDYILSGEKFNEEWRDLYSETSPEETIKKIFVDKIPDEAFKIKPIIELFHKTISENKEKIIGVRGIVQKLTSAPYGVRIGVLPLLVAEAISGLNQYDDSTVTLYFHNKEIELDSTNLGKSLQGVTEDYYFKVDGNAKERSAYLLATISILGGKAQTSANANLQTALALFKNWERNLPQITRTATKAEYPVTINSIDEQFLRELSQYDLNPSDVLFYFLPTLFHAKTFDQTIEAVGKEIGRLTDIGNQISKNEFWDLYGSLGVNNENLLSFLKNILAKNNYQVGTLIGNKAYCSLADYLVTSNLYDDASLIRKISFYIVGSYFEDWVPGTKKAFIEGLLKWEDFIETSSTKEAQKLRSQVSEVISSSSAPKNVSPLVGVLENSIRTSIASFGSSIGEADIVYALANVIKDIKGGKQ